MNLTFLRSAVVSLLASVNSQGAEPATDFRAAARLINDIIRANHYHPAQLENDAYKRIENEVIALGDNSVSADEFVAGFNTIWRQGPFSHVGLRKAEETVAARYARMDTEMAGAAAATLTWKGMVAILAVNTMSGADTVQAINAAYDEIVARNAEKLIIDLRRNGGGAFAVVPLVGHLITKPIDAGIFVVRSWYDDHLKPPGPADFRCAKPWRGYSVAAFQSDVLSRPLTSYRIDPRLPLYRGTVLVLTSARTISAAEIAADALKATGRARIVGEKTPGAVLSSKLFDIPGGFHLRVPFADYYSTKNGRIEGAGVTPDIFVAADEALDVALRL